MDQTSEAIGQGIWESKIAWINDCPFYRLLGMKVVAMEKGYARLVLPVSEKLFQIYGAVHGGVTAALADSAVAVALIADSTEDEKALTVELKLNYVAQVSEGSMIAEARLFHRGRTIVAGEVEVRNDQGRLIAKGMATYMAARSS